MISFVIIGRNEGWKLTKCLESVFHTARGNKLVDFEVIYVDSKSIDDSIDRVKRFNNVKIFGITGDCNAAIARNIGAKESSRNTLFFIDGDMEIQSDFLKEVYDERNGLKYDFVSGDFLNINYDHVGNYINNEKYFNNHEILIQQEVGGVFLLKSENWHLVNGMRSEFKWSEDIDFALRLAKKNIFLKRLPVIAAFHHTIPYTDNRRMWHDFFNFSHLFARSLLYRNNILNPYMYKRIISTDYSLISALICMPLSFINSFTILIYFIILGLRSLKRTKNISSFFTFYFFYFLRDLSVLFGFFLFWPSKPKNLNYFKVQ